MKNRVVVSCLIFMYSFCCFAAVTAQMSNNTIVYVVEKSAATPNTLVIHVDRSDKRTATWLILNALSLGISKQVQDVICDGKPLKESEPGKWFVPNACQKISWQVPIFENEANLAGSQQSIKFGDFILFSEASSLPRLQNVTTPESIHISLSGIKNIFPKPNSLNEIPLPKPHSAPLFVLLNPAIVGNETSSSINLTYFLDNSANITRLPNISSHIKGLQWLSTVIPGKTKENFVIAWLGVSAKQMELAGAAGSGALLANYPNDGELPLGKAMPLYIGLHEAFHQFAMNYPTQPTWISESLASYYGVRALQIASPNDPATSALIKRFLAGSEHFKGGLVTINHQVKNGDQSGYGAFYTKGVAFWMAVNKALQQQKPEKTLDDYLLALFKTKYDAYGKPIDLQQILHLPPKIWAPLYKDFLE